MYIVSGMEVEKSLLGKKIYMGWDTCKTLVCYMGWDLLNLSMHMYLHLI